MACCDRPRDGGVWPGRPCVDHDRATLFASCGADELSSSVVFPGAVADHGAAPLANAPITAVDSYLTPTCATGIVPGTVTLKVTNAGTILHSFTLPDGSIDQDVAPGQTINVAVPVGSAPLVFYCTYHRTSGMVGALVAHT